MADFQKDNLRATLIIPTYNRQDVLFEVLEALEKQDYKNFDVIIADDGSEKGASAEIEKWQFNFPFRYLHQENKGPGAARNLGLKNLAADADIVFFIGDDIIPASDFLSKHLEYHKLFPEENKAVLGLTFWHESVRDKFMDFLAPYGPQFNYSGFKDKDECNFQYLHTCNISFKRKFLQDMYFDEDFRAAAVEDTEFGYRLEKERGLKIIFNPNALAYHKHKYTRKQFLQRQKKSAPWFRLLIEKHPELGYIVIKKTKKILLYATAMILSLPFYLVYKFLPEKFGNYVYRIYNLAYFELLNYWHYKMLKLKI